MSDSAPVLVIVPAGGPERGSALEELASKLAEVAQWSHEEPQ